MHGLHALLADQDVLARGEQDEWVVLEAYDTLRVGEKFVVDVNIAVYPTLGALDVQGRGGR